jgi:signal transduction histidine kinase
MPAVARDCSFVDSDIDGFAPVIGMTETRVHARFRARLRKVAPGRLKGLGPVALLAVGYFFAGKLGTLLVSMHGVSAVWPAAGVAVAGLLVFGPRAWPGIAIGGFLEALSNGFSVPVSAVVSAGQTLAPLAAVAMLRAVRFDRRLTRLVDVLALIVYGAIASSFVTAAIGPSAFAWGGSFPTREWPLPWFAWWVGDVIGVLTVTPPLLLLARPGRPCTMAGRRGEAVVVLAVTAVASHVLFRSSLPLVFLIFPFTLWAALRLGLPGAVAANLVVATIAVWTTVQGQGPLADLPKTVRLVSLGSFTTSVALTSLLLAAAMNERRRALEDVRRSRARIVEAADVERRRLERDLHDGAQARLLSLSYTLGLALARLGPEEPELARTLTGALEESKAAQSELRRLAQGIHPAVLTQEGLAAALESLADQSAVPVETRAPKRRYPAVVEATAYFVVSEALANVAKHSGAAVVRVLLEERNGRLLIEVTDDGAGGADPSQGSGLIGLSDRAAALGGRVSVESPAGAGTRLRAELPCDSP